MKKKVFLGHAVKDGQLRFASVTAIKLFDVRKEGCKRKWAYQYKFGKKPKKIGAQEKGINYAEKLEHYLTTSEDVLPPLLQQAKKFFPRPGPDLECEESLGDMEKALAARDAALKAPPGTRELLLAEVQRFAGLSVNGIPIDGAADFRHVRQEYIDKNGVLCRESPHTFVVNIGDLKTVSQIFPQKILKGENAGKIRMPFTLTDAEICKDVQLVGYGRHAVGKYADMTHARLSLVYTNTRKKNESDLRMAFMSKQQILDEWHGHIEPIVVDMEKHCGAERPEEIEPNVQACDAFMHVDPTDPEGKRVLKGCPHRYYCPLSTMQVGALMLGGHKESAMSLFDSVPGAPTPALPTPPAPQMDAAAYAAQVEEEKRKLLGQVAAPPVNAHPAALGVEGYKPGQLCNGRGYYASANGQGFLPVEAGHKCASCTAVAPPPPPLPQSPIAVNPPDQPRAPTMMQAAAPVPPEAIAEIENPQLRAEVEAHARAHAEKARLEAEAAAAAKVATSVWCPTSATKVIVTAEVAVAGKWVCQCGKSYSVKTLKPLKEGDDLVTVIPRHKPPKKDGEAQAAPPPPAPEKSISITIETDDEEEETSDDAAVVAPPPAPPAPVVAAPPPPPPPPTPSQVVAAADSVIGMAKPSANGTNGHLKVEQLPVSARAFRVDVHTKHFEGDGLVRLVVLAESLKEAITKAEIYGDVLAIEAVPGTVLR